jgi:hypothetical protein
MFLFETKKRNILFILLILKNIHFKFLNFLLKIYTTNKKYMNNKYKFFYFLKNINNFLYKYLP